MAVVYYLDAVYQPGYKIKNKTLLYRLKSAYEVIQMQHLVHNSQYLSY